jgi:malate dehydrogenase (oxaloacetate-decarboxylating)(NADP+)
LFRNIVVKAKQNPKKVVFAEGNNQKVLRAANEVLHEGIAQPVLLGNAEEIAKLIAENHLDLANTPIIDPNSDGGDEIRKAFAELIWEKRQRKGITLDEAYLLTFQRNYYGIMMVEMGLADAMISGVTSHYGDVMSPALKLIGPKPNLNRISSMSIIMTKKRPLFFADITVNLDPDMKTLVETTLLTAEEVRKFNIEPVIALVSYSNFGSVKLSEHTKTLEKVRQTVAYLHKNHPDLIVDGELQMDFALNKELRSQKFPFTRLENRDVNTIIFPTLTAGNIAYKIASEIGGAEVVGPILMGMKKPIHVVPTECTVREIVNMTTIAVVDAQ